MGKWIMLIKKIPTEISPPKMSIHYSEALKPKEDEIESLYDRIKYLNRDFENAPLSVKKKYFKTRGVTIFDGMGESANPILSRTIFYKGEQIRIHSYEYSILTPEKFNEYYPDAYDLVPDEKTKEAYFDRTLNKNQRPVYDAALVDGCTYYEALLVALGKPLESTPPPIGWFRIKKQYGSIWCHEWELEE